jgi:hypothetical protein
MATIDRVDCVIDRALHDRKAERRDGRRLHCSGHDRGGGDLVPVRHGVRVRDLRQGQRDQPRCDNEW